MMGTMERKREFQQALGVAYDARRLEEARDLAWALYARLGAFDVEAEKLFAEARAAGWSPKSERA